MKILVVGPDIHKVPGGMSAVINSQLEASLNSEIDMKYISSNIEDKFCKKVYWMVKGILKYISILPRYDIVHIHVAERGSFYRKSLYLLISKVFKKKSILHFHGAEFDEFYWKECNQVQKKYINYILKKTTLILALGVKWKKNIEKYTTTPVEILTNSISIPNKINYNENSTSILLLGRLEKRKGVFDLLSIIDDVIDRVPQCILYLAGDGNLDKVKSEIRKRKNKNNIKLLGWINKEQKESILKETGIFVLPSYNEGMPIAILEAMSYGLPIVSTNVGDIESVVKDKKNGFIISPGDKEALKESVIELLLNKNMRIKMSKINYDEVYKKYNLEKNTEKLREIYINLYEKK